MHDFFFFFINQSADHGRADSKIFIRTDHGSMMIRCTTSRDIVSSILDNNLYIFDSSFGIQMLKNSATLMGSCKSGWWMIYFLVIIDLSC